MLCTRRGVRPDGWAGRPGLGPCRALWFVVAALRAPSAVAWPVRGGAVVLRSRRSLVPSSADIAVPVMLWDVPCQQFLAGDPGRAAPGKRRGRGAPGAL